MDIEDQIFQLPGPPKLAYIDWKNAAHERAVVACLVQCVYVCERDRQMKPKGDKALAWCETFGFKLKRTLVDKADSSIFGAIFEYKPPPSSCNHSADGPRFVVAFRGTLLKIITLTRDIWLDILIGLNRLHFRSRCQTAIQVVEDLVATAGDSREVWLTGHSLGSAIALQAGKNMAKKEVYLESLLFNPPYPSVPTEKWPRHLAKSVLRAGLALVTQSQEKQEQSASSFAACSPWAPQLFVNKDDVVCSGYIGYFKYQKGMLKYGLEDFAKFASQYSVRSMLVNVYRSENEARVEPSHLIPSANLTINLKPPKSFLSAHGISEWWKLNLELESEVYKN